MRYLPGVQHPSRRNRREKERRGRFLPTLEALSKLVAIVGAIAAAVLGIRQYERGVDQSIRELNWKRAEQARSMVDAMLKDEGWEAMTMLDWPGGRRYELPSKQRVVIYPHEIPAALWASISSSSQRHLDPRTGFIGDRYDRFFMVVGQLQIAVRSGLVNANDIQFPIDWYVRNRLCWYKPLLELYMDANSSSDDRDFFASMEAWKQCPVPAKMQ